MRWRLNRQLSMSDRLLSFQCTACQGVIEFPDSGAGQRVACPRCSSVVVLAKLSASTKRHQLQQEILKGVLLSLGVLVSSMLLTVVIVQLDDYPPRRAVISNPNSYRPTPQTTLSAQPVSGSREPLQRKEPMVAISHPVHVHVSPQSHRDSGSTTPMVAVSVKRSEGDISKPSASDNQLLTFEELGLIGPQQSSPGTRQYIPSYSPSSSYSRSSRVTRENRESREINRLLEEANDNARMAELNRTMQHYELLGEMRNQRWDSWERNRRYDDYLTEMQRANAELRRLNDQIESDSLQRRFRLR